MPMYTSRKVFVCYTQFIASGTGLVGRYQNFDRLLGTVVDIKFLERMGHCLKEHYAYPVHCVLKMDSKQMCPKCNRFQNPQSSR